VRAHVYYALQKPSASWAHAGDPALDAECQQQEQLYLDGTAKMLDAISHVPVSTAVVPGLAEDGIDARRRQVAADLVVMATHGHGAVSRFFLGSVADELIRHVETPVLLVRPQEPPPDLLPESVADNVLIPLDGSPLAEQVLGPAADLARLLQARCTLFRVVEPNGKSGRPGEAEGYLRGIADRLRGQELAVDARVVVAPRAADAISEEAARAGLIALSTHGRGGVRRLLLGSAADKVIRGTSLPILVYRPPTPAAVRS